MLGIYTNQLCYVIIPLSRLNHDGDSGFGLHIQRGEIIRVVQISRVALQFRCYGLRGLCDPINVTKRNICIAFDSFKEYTTASYPH